LTKKKKKTNRDREGIIRPKIRLYQDAMATTWGTISAIAAFITAIVSAGVLIYTFVQYIQISK